MQSKFVKNWFPIDERGKANATRLIGLSVAPMVAMPLFTWIIPVMGWRGNFFFLAALGVIPFIMIRFFTADHPQLHRRINGAEKDYIEAALKAEREKERGIHDGDERDRGLLRGAGKACEGVARERQKGYRILLLFRAG
jgi:MFS family permease